MGGRGSGYPWAVSTADASPPSRSRPGAPLGILGAALLAAAIGCPSSEPAAPVCGNGVLETAEECEGSPPPEGCSEACTVAPGWQCDDLPSADGGTGTALGSEWQSTCTQLMCCGNGAIEEGELCDDGNDAEDDGCFGCQIEPGWACEGEPSVCARCGDGLVASGLEECDNGNGPGCNDLCQVVMGWECTGEPSLCTPVCGDGIWLGEAVFGVTAALAEGCDDGNTEAGDGCSPDCEVEPGCACSAQPTQTSACTCPGDSTTGGPGDDTSTGGESSASGTGSETSTGSETGTDSGSSTTTG
jgi:large repetitive protein